MSDTPPNDDLNQPGADLAAPPATKTKAKTGAKGMPEAVWILLEENEEIPPTGLFVGHNGTGYLLRAGEPVRVPWFIVDILDHAITTVTMTDPTTRQVIGHRDRRRYPYRRVDAPDGQE